MSISSKDKSAEHNTNDWDADSYVGDQKAVDIVRAKIMNVIIETIQICFPDLEEALNVDISVDVVYQEDN